MKSLRLLGAVSTYVLCITFSSPAQSIDWLCDTGGNWGDTGCWSGGTVPGTSDLAEFNTGATSPYTVNFNSSVTTDYSDIYNDDLIWDLGGNTYTSTRLLRVGLGSGNIANLQIVNGTLSSGQSDLGDSSGSSATVSVSGAGSSWNAGSLQIGGQGESTLTIDNAGNVTSTSASLGSWFGSTGSATVSGTGSSWTLSGALVVGDIGTGALDISNGGVVTSNSGVLGGRANGSGVVTVSGNGSSWDFAGATTFIGGNERGVGGTGILNVQDGGTVTGGGLTVYETGAINLSSGGSLSVTGTYTTSGDVTVNGNLSANAVEVLDGKVTGNGTIIGDLMNRGGQVRPGNSPGTLTIDGNYTQEVGGSIIFEIAGLNAGEYDVLNILGTATFDPGTSIDLIFTNGFAPSTDDVFDFLLADTFASDMDLVTFNILGLQPGFDFDVGFTDSGTFNMTALSDGVVATPIPGAVWLFGSGLLGLIGASRRKKAT